MCWPFCCLSDISMALQRLRLAGFYLFGILGLPIVLVLFLLAVCYTQGGPAEAIGNWAITLFGSTFGADMIVFFLTFSKGYLAEIEWRNGPKAPTDAEAPAAAEESADVQSDHQAPEVSADQAPGEQVMTTQDPTEGKEQAAEASESA